MEPPRVSAYSVESVIVEKFEAALDLADLNSRMKDFYDIWALSNSYEFDGKVLQEAITTTCSKRQTVIEAQAEMFSEGFAHRTDKQTQWRAFIRKGTFEQTPETFILLMNEIRTFLLPITESIQKHQTFKKRWAFDQKWSGKDSKL